MYGDLNKTLAPCIANCKRCGHPYYYNYNSFSRTSFVLGVALYLGVITEKVTSWVAQKTQIGVQTQTRAGAREQNGSTRHARSVPTRRTVVPGSWVEREGSARQDMRAKVQRTAEPGKVEGVLSSKAPGASVQDTSWYKGHTRAFPGGVPGRAMDHWFLCWAAFQHGTASTDVAVLYMVPMCNHCTR